MGELDETVTLSKKDNVEVHNFSFALYSYVNKCVHWRYSTKSLSSLLAVSI
jgi:hypothetical protein